MSPKLYQFAIPIEVLQRGFWLCVWQINLRDGPAVYYVGRTGDSSSLKAQSPFSRVRTHVVEMLYFGRPHCFADLSQRRSQSFFKRGMIEGKLQYFGRRLATLDRPGKQVRDVIQQVGKGITHEKGRFGRLFHFRNSSGS
jgi:hypothetical protein